MPGPPLIVGNWKMNGRVANVAEVRDLGQDLVNHPVQARVVVCAPATLLHLVCRAPEGSGAWAGAQDCHPESDGPFTGALSADFLPIIRRAEALRPPVGGVPAPA